MLKIIGQKNMATAWAQKTENLVIAKAINLDAPIILREVVEK